MNTKTKEGARNKGNPYFLRVPWNKGGLVNTGPEVTEENPESKEIQNGNTRKYKDLPSGEWIASLNFKDIYFLIPINTESRKYLRLRSILLIQRSTIQSIHCSHGIYNSSQGGRSDG